MPTRIFGWVAVGLSLTYKFPQIYKLWKTQDVRGISVLSQIVQGSAYAFYIVHGTLIQDGPVTLLGIASLAQSLVLVAQYYYYRKSNVSLGISRGSTVLPTGREADDPEIGLNS